MRHETCPTCGQAIKRPRGRPVGTGGMTPPIAAAVAAVASGKMTVIEAAKHYGVTRSAIYRARNR